MEGKERGGDDEAALLDEKVAKARRRVEDLKKELYLASQDLKKLDPETDIITSENAVFENDEHKENGDTGYGGSKRGYLWKWQDRAIGWGGTKWGLRFVVLEQGRLAYYQSHKDITPRYVLVLKGCAVRDEGVKTKSSLLHIPNSNNSEQFFVFSIYLRSKVGSNNNTDSNGNNQNSTEGMSVVQDDEQITPLLRFSTTSQAEKNQWINFISEACAYCESEVFASRNPNGLNRSILIEQSPASLPLQVEPGKIAPISFGGPRFVKLRPTTKKMSRKAHLFKSKSVSNRLTTLTSTYPPSRPMHQSACPSYLSDEAGTQNYRGLLNLALIMLLISNFHFLLDAIKTYGLIFSTNTPHEIYTYFHGYTQAPLEQFPFFTGMALLPIFVLYAFLIELQLSKRLISESLGTVLHQANAHLSILIPIIIIWCFISNPAIGAALLMTSTITWTKLLSYSLANNDYRTSKQDSYQATLALISDLQPSQNAYQMKYPVNISLPNIFYFWFAPTLTYQMAFPTSPSIRWYRVITLSLRLFIAIALLMFLGLQVIAPNLDSLIEDYQKQGITMSTGLGAEYLIKLAVSSTYAWLLFFYIYFHLFLNLLAEILQFGDRVFYKDWWNASEVSSYWRLWNMPVHYWLIRHVYFPCIRCHMSKTTSTLVVFFVSAVLHEVLISVPFHMVSYWSFLGMMGQLPLIYLTKYFDKKFQGTSFGNIIFWLSFCVVGQPMAILLYAIDFWERSITVDESVGTETVLHNETVCEL